MFSFSTLSGMFAKCTLMVRNISVLLLWREEREKKPHPTALTLVCIFSARCAVTCEESSISLSLMSTATFRRLLRSVYNSLCPFGRYKKLNYSAAISGWRLKTPDYYHYCSLSALQQRGHIGKLAWPC